MVTLDEAVTAKLETHGLEMQILVDPEIALRFREEKGNLKLDLDDLLAASAVFVGPARDGAKASNEELMKAFGTTDLEEAVKKILLKGDLQLTTDQRRRMVERKRRLIIQHIARNAINPQTKSPHPPSRIETAMDEARIHLDPFKSVEASVQDVMKAIRPLIPIRIETVQVAVKLPATHAGKAHSILRGFGELKQEAWQSDGSWIGVVELPGGMQTEFYDELNKKTHGEAETRLLKSSSVS
ncbi:MAG TPA: ribosome assembly factor SBDS [Candidatus Thermoplasmatota archaeon]|nr:ribosome assembly factor SBDS [Candidatus Thermoplasmatota archaeon]